MATKTRIEYGNVYRASDAYANMLKEVPATALTISVGATPTVAGDRPTVPAGITFAIVVAVDGNVIVAPPGANPTANQTSGKLCVMGVETPIQVKAGQKLSFIELA